MDLKEKEVYKTFYILEEKLNKKAQKKCISDVTKALHHSGEIKENKLKALISNINDGWIISDAVSFSDNYNQIVDFYKHTIKYHPLRRFRVIKANCLYNVIDDGIALIDYDYLRLKMISLPKSVIFLRVKSIFNSLISKPT